MQDIFSSTTKLRFWSERILKIEDHPLPIHLVAAVTGKCNLKCSFCYLLDNKPIDLDFNELKNFIEKLPSLKSIEITGGEPTLYPQINELIEYTKDFDGAFVNVLIMYDGQAEIVDAMKDIINDNVSPDKIDRTLIKNYLYTSSACIYPKYLQESPEVKNLGYHTIFPGLELNLNTSYLLR